jgi:hypothetical protein
MNDINITRPRNTPIYLIVLLKIKYYIYSIYIVIKI